MRRNDPREPSLDACVEIRRHADALLRKAGAYGKFPTPVADLVAAAGMRVEHALFDDDRILRQMAEAPAALVRRARSKLLGAVDIRGRTIYVRPDIPLSYLPPLVLHEAAHALLSWHRDAFLFMEEDRSALLPDVRDDFEREANQFAWEALFQLDRFRLDAENAEFSLRTPVRLARRYGTTCYAAIRWFVRTNHRLCALLILGRPDRGPRWMIRRIVESPGFAASFGEVSWVDAIQEVGSGMLLSGGEYQARHSLSLFNIDRRQVACEVQSFDYEDYRFVMVYPERELCAVRMS